MSCKARLDACLVGGENCSAQYSDFDGTTVEHISDSRHGRNWIPMSVSSWFLAKRIFMRDCTRGGKTFLLFLFNSLLRFNSLLCYSRVDNSNYRKKFRIVSTTVSSQDKLLASSVTWLRYHEYSSRWISTQRIFRFKIHGARLPHSIWLNCCDCTVEAHTWELMH